MEHLENLFRDDREIYDAIEAERKRQDPAGGTGKDSRGGGSCQ